MSLPIRETPILYGEDAQRFIENTKNARKHPISRQDFERAKKIYNNLKVKNNVFINS
jgi:hypothetical protein